MKKISSIILAFIFGTLFSQAEATTFYVKSNGGSDSNNGLSESTALLSLSKALNLSSLTDGDIIEIEGTFKYNIGKYLTKSVIIRAKENTLATIQGVAGSAKNAFNLNSKTSPISLTLENIIFENFDNYDELSAKQGGVLNVTPGSTLICRNVTFKNNQCYMGGAINISGGNVTLEDCTFTENKTKVRPDATNADGGAINISLGNTDALTLNINRCLFENNSTENSGAAVRFRTITTGKVDALVANSTFTGNTTKEIGKDCGTLFIQGTSTDASIQIINNTFAYNKTEKSTKNANAALSIGGMGAYVSLYNNLFFSNFNAETTPKSVSITSNLPLKESRNNITDMSVKAFDFNARTAAGMASGNINDVTAEKLLLATTVSNEGGKTKVLTITKPSIAADAAYTEKAPKVDQRNLSRDSKPDVGAFEIVKSNKK